MGARRGGAPAPWPARRRARSGHSTGRGARRTRRWRRCLRETLISRSSTTMPRPVFRPASLASATDGLTPTAMTRRLQSMRRPSSSSTALTQRSPSIARVAVPSTTRIPFASSARLSRPRRCGIELTLHQPVHQMDQRYTRSGADQAVGRLDAEQSAADHDGRAFRFCCRLEDVGVLQRAKRDHAFKIAARQWKAYRLGPGGQNADVERYARAVAQNGDTARGFEARDRLPRAQA